MQYPIPPISYNSVRFVMDQTKKQLVFNHLLKINVSSSIYIYTTILSTQLLLLIQVAHTFPCMSPKPDTPLCIIRRTAQHSRIAPFRTIGGVSGLGSLIYVYISNICSVNDKIRGTETKEGVTNIYHYTKCTKYNRGGGLRNYSYGHTGLQRRRMQRLPQQSKKKLQNIHKEKAQSNRIKFTRLITL